MANRFLYAIAILLLAFIACNPIHAATVYVAQGDLVTVPQIYPNGTCWLFPNSGVGDLDYYDYPSKFNSETNQTYCTISKEFTANKEAGNYNLVYESPVLINGYSFKDISYVNGTLQSALGYVKPIDINGLDAPVIQNKLESLILTDHLNNVSVDRVVIEKPLLSITSLGPITDQVYALHKTSPDSDGIVTTDIISSPFYRISGRTNLPNGTKITIKVDETRFFSQHAKDSKYIFTTTASRPPEMDSAQWSCDFGFNVNDLPAGWHDITVYGGDLVSTVKFKVDQQIKPTPTPTEYINYLSNGDIAPIIVNHTITVIQTQYVDRWHTATPTPDITDALGNKIDYPYEPGATVPPEVGLICLLAIAVIILMRGYKKK